MRCTCTGGEAYWVQHAQRVVQQGSLAHRKTGEVLRNISFSVKIGIIPGDRCSMPANQMMRSMRRNKMVN
jgi:hypothetical protein